MLRAEKCPATRFETHSEYGGLFNKFEILNPKHETNPKYECLNVQNGIVRGDSFSFLVIGILVI